MSVRIRREEARLRALFERLLVLSITASPLSCSPSHSDAAADSGPTATADGDAGGGLDATVGGDATAAASNYGFADAACDPILLDAAVDDSGCDFLESLPCGLPPDAQTEACYVALAECAVLCGLPASLQRTCAIAECLVADASTIPATTPLTLECARGGAACGAGAGRRPAGFSEASPARSRDAVGGALAVLARLEAASVGAFRELGTELAAMRAPRSLVRAAERSARDEVRHARVMSRLAHRRGAAPAPVSRARGASARSLEAFAIENAVEGCVRETFGALAAMHQATRAPDPEIAREMRRIARDETRHAALAWEIARWTEPRLSPAARRRVRRAMGAALRGLRCEVNAAPDGVARALGLPAGRDGARLVDAFEAALFAS